MVYKIPLKCDIDANTGIYNLYEFSNTDIIATQNLGTGSPNSDTYLAGDGSWKTIIISKANTSTSGIVKLNDTVTSSNTDLAATANSVKTAYDLASTKLNSSGGTISGDLTVSGVLTINGTTTIVNSTTVTIDDPIMTLGGDTSQVEITKDRGIEAKWNGSTLTITNYIGNGTTTVTGTVASTTGWSAGDIITISGATGTEQSKLNGTWTISSITATTFTFIVASVVTTGTYTTTLGTTIKSKNVFFGLDQSTGKFTFIPQATNSGEVFSGTKGYIDAFLTASDLNGTIPSTVLGNSTHYIGTTAVTLNRASANLGLTGISSIALPGATSGTITLTPTANAGSTTITLPAANGTVITTGDTGTVTSTMIADGTIVNADISASAAISTSKITGLAASATTDTTNANNITSGILSNSRLSAVPNSALANSSVTVTAGTGLSGGGAVALGSSITLNANTANTTIAGIVQLNDTVTSNLTSQAATANSVKTAYDLASTKLNSSGGTISGDLVVSGDLTVSGNTTTLNTINLAVEDNIVELRSGNNIVAGDGGIQINLTTAANGVSQTSRTIKWTNASNRFQLTNDGNTYSNIIVATDTANTTNAGIVQLDDTVTNNSTTLAATANAIYTLNNKLAKITVTGGTDVGNNLVNLANPNANSFIKINANNTVSTLNAGNFRSEIGAANLLTIYKTDGTGINVALTNDTTGASTSNSSSIALVSGKLSQFANTTSSELAGVITDETGTGNLVFSTSPTLTTPNIGAATATSVNKVNITAPANAATLTLADGSSLITSGAFSTTLTATANTSVTLPTSGTLAVNNQTMYVGTTAVTLNRASANLGLTGISSIALPGATSGTVTLQPTANAGSTTITLPAANGTVITTGDTGTVTSTMIANNSIVDADISASAAIATSKIFGLAASATTDTTNANNITSGTISTARLGTGTANSSTYLAGNNTWQTVTGGATITDDTATNASYYPLLATATSGTLSASKTSSTKLYYNPSTGTMSATSFNSLSDITLKTDIISLNNSIEILKLLHPVSFKWKDNGKKSYGLIAQEVEEILPELVETDPNGIKSVNYSAIIPFLIDAIVSLSK